MSQNKLFLIIPIFIVAVSLYIFTAGLKNKEENFPVFRRSTMKVPTF